MGITNSQKYNLVAFIVFFAGTFLMFEFLWWFVALLLMFPWFFASIAIGTWIGDRTFNNIEDDDER